MTLNSIKATDPEIASAIEKEYGRQAGTLELIASENIVSRAVMAAQGSVLTNKYAEGYPDRRYYGGCEFADIAESLAIERAKELFQAEYANVQPHFPGYPGRAPDARHCRQGGRPEGSPVRFLPGLPAKYRSECQCPAKGTGAL